jgi:alcohol dehydrogenase class IV
MSRLARALDCAPRAVPAALFELGRRHGVPPSLAAIGMPPDGLDVAANEAIRSPYPNPRPLERAAIRELLQRAFDGSDPLATGSP